MPTEAEWECSCRAGTTTKYWISDKDEDFTRAGWFGTNSGGRTHAVEELKANPFGLYDIHGNVWEWVQDGWDANFYGQFLGNPAINPNNQFTAGSQHVVRGGDWYIGVAFNSRSAFRHTNKVGERHTNLGFRVSLTVDGVRQ